MTIMLRTSTTSPFDLIDDFTLTLLLDALPDQGMAQAIADRLHDAQGRPLVFGNVELTLSFEELASLQQAARTTPL